MASGVRSAADMVASIWSVLPSLDEINAMSCNSLQSLLNIEVVEIGSDYLIARMPVTSYVHQPHGVLHGGASVVLAEATGSLAAALCVPPDRRCVGLEVNANHIASISEGDVWCVGRPAHLGGSTQVWQMRIFDKNDRTICVARLTVAVLRTKASPLQGAETLEGLIDE